MGTLANMYCIPISLYGDWFQPFQATQNMSQPCELKEFGFGTTVKENLLSL